jgi:glycosyltransferase involved in cell wall biosynthesis
VTVVASVIVPTKNGARRLPDLFAALERQTVGRDAFEVVLVDDGSTDDTAAVAEAFGARVVRSPVSQGPGAASNLGAEHARSDALAFTDDDTIPAPDWIERGLAALEASESGLVGGRIDLLLADAPTLPALVDYGRGYLDQSGYVADGFAATANLWARRDVLRDLGGFKADAAFQTHDRDFGERARAAGRPIAYCDDAVVAHPTRDRARDLAKVAYRLGFGAAWLRRNAPGAQGATTPEWRRPTYWLPWRSIWGLDRLQARGHARTRLQRLQLRAVQYACLQLPVAWGSLRGSRAVAPTDRRDGA